jgi:DNA repair protein RadD
VDLVSPGYAWAALVEAAPLDDIKTLLGAPLLALVQLLTPGTDTEDRLRQVAAKALDPEKLLAVPCHRELVLRAVPAPKSRELATRLGAGTRHDPLAYLLSLAWTAAQRRTACGFLGQVVDRQPRYVAESTDCTPKYGLFPHQRQAAARVRALLYSPPRRAVLHLPTGVGKTRTAMNLICQHLRQTEPTLVIWLAHGVELLDQAAAEFEVAWSCLGDRPVPVRRMWGSTDADLGDHRDGLVVLGLEKAVSLFKNNRGVIDRLSARTSLVVFDEAHQIVAPTYRMVADALTIKPMSSLLGLTATPGRTWADIEQDERLSEYFARQKVVLQIEGHSNPVTALIDQGYLSKPTFRTVASRSGIRLTSEDRRRLAKSVEIPQAILDRAADDEQWNLQVVTTIRQLMSSHHRVLVFAASVNHCRLIAGVLSSMGHVADFVTGESSPRHREQVIARFKDPRGPSMALCNYGVLTTGFDAPAASATVIARPTKSLVLYSQMVGRVIRGPRAGGTPTCEIVTVVNPELPGFGDVAEAFTNWEDVWENL